MWVSQRKPFAIQTRGGPESCVLAAKTGSRREPFLQGRGCRGSSCCWKDRPASHCKEQKPWGRGLQGKAHCPWGAGREDDILCALGRTGTTPSCGHERPPIAESIPTCPRPSRDKGRVTARAPRPKTGQDYAELPSPPLGRARLSKPVTALKLQVQETQRNPLRSCRNSNYIHVLVGTYV